jgi:DNA-binding NarL/FixJ family response regulator
MTDFRKIAIVDDHTLFRKGLCSLINLFSSYKVLFEAENGNDLITKVQSGLIPDIVLLDIAMPSMNGFATAEWITENYPEIRIIALSTMDSEMAIIKMIRHGAKGYILKDAEPAELKQAFDEVMIRGYYYNDLVSTKIVRSVNSLISSNSELNHLAKLTDRETQFLGLACSEKTYAQIAKEMFLSERTIDGYRDSLFKKLNVQSRVGLVLYAIRNGVVTL